MSKKKLCEPIYTIFRRETLASIANSSYSPIYFWPPQINPSASVSALCPSTLECLRSPQSLGFSRKQFSSNSSKSQEGRCWNCDAVDEASPYLVCRSCQTIQPLDHSINYFQIFGLEKKYDMGDVNLEGRYKEWQKKLHPDLVHSKSEREREYSAEQSARVIDAFRTLSKPLSRAKYILKLEGVEVDEEQTILDPELLAEILEIREAVEEATDSQALNGILSKMHGKLEDWSNSFANAFQSQNFEEAKNSIRRMTYYERVIEEIVKKL